MLASMLPPFELHGPWKSVRKNLFGGGSGGAKLQSNVGLYVVWSAIQVENPLNVNHLYFCSSRFKLFS